MSNDVSNSRIYAFLTSFNDKGSWITAADQDGDQHIMRCEFYDFIKKNWDGEKTLSDDVIDRFWNSLDTNKSTSKIKGTSLRNLNALDKTEMKNLEAQLDLYIVFDQFFGAGGPVEMEKNALRTQGLYTKPEVYTQWKATIKDYLAPHFAEKIQSNPEISTEALNDFLKEKFAEIKDEVTIELIVTDQLKRLKETLLKDYNYNPNEDSVLQDLLNNYINQYMSSANPVNYSEVKKGIINIINQYMKASGINGELTGGDSVGPSDIDNINNLGFSDNVVNQLQISTLMDLILKNEKALFDKYKDKSTAKHDYLSDAKNYLKQLIEEKVVEGYTFEELKTLKFEGSEYHTKLDNLINYDESYDEFEDTSAKDDLYDTVSENFGKDFAESLESSDSYLSIYKEIVLEVRNACINGEVDFGADAMNEIFKGILLNLSKFYPNGISSKFSLNEINKIYDNLVKSAEAQDSTEKTEEKLREAALMYCEAFVGKGHDFKDAVTELFGSNYKTQIKTEMDVSEICAKIDELKEKAVEFIDYNNLTVNWDSSNINDLAIIIGKSHSFKPSITISDGDKNVDVLPTISAKVTRGSGSVSIQGDTVTITAPNYTDTMQIEFAVYVNGVKIDTKKINVESTDDIIYENNVIVDNHSLNDLITNHDTAMLIAEGKFRNIKSYAIEKIKEILKKLATDLIEVGYCATNVNKAATTTLNYYSAAIGAMQDFNGDTSGQWKHMINFTYVDAEGKSFAEEGEFFYGCDKSWGHGNNDDYECRTMDVSGTGISLCTNYQDHSNDHRIHLNIGIMLNKFRNFMFS